MATQLLLFAEPLLWEGLSQLLSRADGDYQVVSQTDGLAGAPQLVIWHLGTPPSFDNLAREVTQLQQRWQPAPVLVLLPEGQPHSASQLLQLPLAGLLEAPTPDELLEAIATLLAGGRVVALAQSSGALDPTPAAATPLAATSLAALGPGNSLDLGHSLFWSGIQQIDAEMAACLSQLNAPRRSLLHQWIHQGRLRELRAARLCLILLWGSEALPAGPGSVGSTQSRTSPQSSSRQGTARIGIQLHLPLPSADGIWQTLQQRLEAACQAGLTNNSGQLLALEGLHPQRRADLLQALLTECDRLRRQLASDQLQGKALQERWNERQLDLRQQALRSTVSSYVQLPKEGALQPVADVLLNASDLAGSDPELPEAQAMLVALVQGQPLLVDGVLVPIDEPRAVLHLERLLSNWLVRTAEQISSEVLACCADWPELRRYLLTDDLLATRSLERLRNQLNAQQRWRNWVERPVALYESRRSLFCLQDGAISSASLTEPRDNELRQLSWGQQLVTLALETRDALAPQLHSLLKGLGDLLVVLLTQVVGRSIGLVGRGIRQGLGRSLSRG